MRQSDFDAFFDPEESQIYEVDAQRSASGWDVEVEQLRLNFSVPSEPEVFSRAISMIAKLLNVPPYRVMISVSLAQ